MENSMRKYFIGLVVLLASQGAFASAFDSLNDQELQEASYKLLVLNKDKISISGDIRSDETLSSILLDVEKYNQSIEELLSGGGDLETELKSNISSVDAKCALNSEKSAANCNLTITFFPLGETSILYSVGLDKNQKAVSISSRAEVVRGD
jgi:hypothetical protein